MIRRVGLLAALLMVLAIGYLILRPQAAPAFHPAARFVNSWMAPAPRTIGYNVATLRDETRFVLQTPTHALVLVGDVQVPPGGRVTQMIELRKMFNAAARVALVPHYRRGTVRTKLPLALADVAPGEERPKALLDVQLPPELAGEIVGIDVEAFAVDIGSDSEQRTGAAQIPRNAYLSFAIGIVQPEPAPAAVEFIVRTCRADDCRPLFSEIVQARAGEDNDWLERRVSLADLAGETVSLSFETRRRSGDGASFPLWANPTIYAPEKTGRDSPNVILLSIDTLAAQHLGFQGYGFDTAPFLAQLGQGGTVFDRCVAAATTTPQSHMTMLTGVQPCVHGVIIGTEEASPSLVTLAEALRAQGYETGAVTEDGWLGYEHGFGRGFDVYAENKSADIMAPTGQVDATFARARRWLEENRDKRFFLFLHTFQVHDPYSPPEAYRQLFTERDGKEVTAESPRAVRDSVAYDQEIRYTDDEVRKLFAFLEERGLAENTVFIVTSDHGEEFLQHGLYGHGATFYEEVTHVPLLFRGPGIAAGQRLATPVAHVDLMPTILELAGVAPPSQGMGTSLAALLRGEAAPPAMAHRPLYGESRVEVAIDSKFEPIPITPPGFLVQRGLEKLARYRRDGGFAYEYYDLATDPGEQHNRFADNPQGVAELKPLVDGYENLCLAAALNAGDTSPGQQQKIPLDPAAQEKLRALGYLK